MFFVWRGWGLELGDLRFRVQRSRVHVGVNEHGISYSLP